MSQETGGRSGSAHAAHGGPSAEGDTEDDEASSFNLRELTLDSPQEDAPQENVESALSAFRQNWQRELESPAKTIKNDSATKDRRAELWQYDEDNRIETDEEKAKSLFLKGVELERNGELYEAIVYYKRAVQLIPDIELKIYESTKIRATGVEESSNHSTILNDTTSINEKNETTAQDSEADNYKITIERKVQKSGFTCIPDLDDKNTHISALPIELLMYILRWVVSSDLDMISLERFASVCCSFYICGRDPEIWRLACVRTWGIHCGTYKLHGYKSWRDMFIERPRLRFNGCYISRTSYVRPGENSFQDQFYRPWHLVKYFRYLRFFPDGIVLMMTTPDEPITCLDRLKQRTSKVQGVLSGHYRLSGDKVVISIGKSVNNQSKQNQANNSRFRQRRRESANETIENTYQLELQLKSHYPQMFCSLVWRSYTILGHNKSNGALTTTAFEIVKSKFPSFKFSQVKRFHARTDSLLQ